MKRLILYGLIGLIAYAVFMVTQFPAARFIGVVADYVPGFSARQAQGSAFQGNAQGLRWRDGQLESLSWRWRPLSLLTGRVSYELIAAEPHLDLEAVAGVSWSRQVRIKNIEGQLALSKAMTLLGRPPLLLEGDLQLAMDELSLQPGGYPSIVEGTARLRETHTTLGRSLELGDFSAEFRTDDQAILGTVRDDGGPLELNGTLTLAPDGRYRFTGQLGLRDETSRELRQILSIMGQPGADGKWQLNFTGSLKS